MKKIITIFNRLFSTDKEKTSIKSESNSTLITVDMMRALEEGIKLSDAKHYREALIKLDLAIESGIFKEAYSERGICLQMLEFHLDAIDDFNKAIDLFPTDANNYFFRSMSKKEIGEYDAAIFDNKQAILLSQSNSVENQERNLKAKNLGYDAATQFYQFRLEFLEEEANSSVFMQHLIVKSKIRRNK